MIDSDDCNAEEPGSYKIGESRRYSANGERPEGCADSALCYGWAGNPDGEENETTGKRQDAVTLPGRG
jgi:hypothetical protein